MSFWTIINMKRSSLSVGGGGEAFNATRKGKLRRTQFETATIVLSTCWYFTGSTPFSLIFQLPSPNCSFNLLVLYRIYSIFTHLSTTLAQLFFQPTGTLQDLLHFHSSFNYTHPIVLSTCWYFTGSTPFSLIFQLPSRNCSFNLLVLYRIYSIFTHVSTTLTQTEF
jgi:hypothetical protein